MIRLQKMKQKGRSFAESWWAIGVIALLVFGVVYQRWQFMHPTHAVVARAGDRIPAVTFETLDHQEVQINWGANGKSTIVYAFAPSCAWCKRNLAAMKTVAANAQNYHFIAVSITADGVSEFVKRTV